MRRGFTLIELLVVISIIAILIALSIFGLQGARAASRDARRKVDLEQIRSGLEIYKADCNSYPLSTGAGAFSLPGSTTLVGPSSGVTGCAGNTYISAVPQDPMPSRQYSYVSTDGKTYIICASLEQGSGSVSGCGSCGTACNIQLTNP